MEGDVCDVGSGVVMEEADGPMYRVLPLSLTSPVIQLFVVQLHSDAVFGWLQFKEQYALAVTPD